MPFLQLNGTGDFAGEQLILTREKLGSIEYMGQREYVLQCKITKNDCNIEAIQSAVLNFLGQRIPVETAQQILDYATADKEKPENHGLDLMKVRIRGGQQFPSATDLGD